MDYSLLFQIFSKSVVPAWLVLVFFPKNSWRNMAIYCFAFALALVYTSLMITSLGKLDMQSLSTLEGLKEVFTSDKAVLSGWVHYLIFDLLVGNWIVNNAQKHGIKHYLVIPCLLFCFMLGPLGFVLYSIIKLFKLKTLNE